VVYKLVLKKLRPRQAVVEHTYFTVARVANGACRSFSELRRRRPSLLQVQGCQWKHVVGSRQNVAFIVLVGC